MSDRETDELVAIVERGMATALRGTTTELLRRITLTENDRHAHRVAGRAVEAAACAIREQAPARSVRGDERASLGATPSRVGQGGPLQGATMKPGRAGCAVPFCRITAPTAEGFVDQEFLCRRHWALRPPAMKAEWLALNRLLRRNPGVFWDHPPGSPGRLIRVRLERDHRELWGRTKATCIEIAMGITS